MGKKYFVWSFDDGLEQDKKIIEILKKYEMGATFNLNSGMTGTRNVIGRIKDYGMYVRPETEISAKKFHFLKYVQSYRIPDNEIKDVYHGYEVASHSEKHENLIKITPQQATDSIINDVARLSELTGGSVQGFAYPFGARNDKVEKIVEKQGFVYARTIKVSDSFRITNNLMQFPITAWHISKNVFTKLEQFFSSNDEEPQIFLMFAHGYEFDFDTQESSWKKFEKICDMVRGHENIVCCSTIEAINSIRSEKKLN